MFSLMMQPADICLFLQELRPHFLHDKVKPSLFIVNDKLTLRVFKGGKLWDVVLNDDKALDSNAVTEIVALVSSQVEAKKS